MLALSGKALLSDLPLCIYLMRFQLQAKNK